MCSPARAVLAYVLAVPLVYVVLTLVPLVRSYRESGVEAKRQLRWPLWGVSVASASER